MKKLLLLICLFGAMTFTGCKNNEVGDESLLIGKWQVVKTDLYTGYRKETINRTKENIYWVFTSLTATYCTVDKNGEPYDLTLPCTFTRNDDNSLFYLFNGQVYTIEKLNQNEMELNHLDFLGGATYYDYLKRVK